MLRYPYFAHCLQHSDKGKVKAVRRDFSVGSQRWAALDRQARKNESKEVIGELVEAKDKYMKDREVWTAEWDTVQTREVLADVQTQHQERLKSAANAVPIAPELTVQFVERFNSHTTRLNQLLVTCNEAKTKHLRLDSDSHDVQEQIRGLTDEVDEAREKSHAAVTESRTLRTLLGTIRGKKIPNSAVVSRVLAIEKEKKKVGKDGDDDAIPWWVKSSQTICVTRVQMRSLPD